MSVVGMGITVDREYDTDWDGPVFGWDKWRERNGLLKKGKQKYVNGKMADIVAFCHIYLPMLENRVESLTHFKMNQSSETRKPRSSTLKAV